MVRAALGTGGVHALNALLGLAIAVLLTRALGPAGYGDYAFALSVATMLTVGARLGLPVLAVREVARYHLWRDWARLRGFLRYATAAALVAATLIVGLLAFLWSSWILLLIPPLALLGVWGAALRGLQRIVTGHVPELVVLPAALLLIAACALWIRPATPQLAMTAHAAAAGLAAAVAALLLRQALRREHFSAARPAFEVRAWSRSAGPLLLFTGLQIVNGQVDIFLLGVLGSAADVGLYRVAVQASHLLASVMYAVNIALAPNLSRLHADGDREGLQRVALAGARGVFCVALPAAAVLAVFGGPILEAVFGAQYRPAHAPLAILCAAQVAFAAIGFAGLMLNMTGHERDTAGAFGLAALANVLLNLALIPRFGITGAAAATSVTLVALNLLLWRQAWVRLGIQTGIVALRLARQA